jgi:ABC-type phosphate transport system substrate-binding protein/transcriptional regulator with XRE-family HTH domain
MARPEAKIPEDAPPALARLASALRDLRKSSGLNLTQLADKASCSVGALSEAASGKRVPTWEIMRAYVAGCDGTPDDWLGLWQAASGSGGDHAENAPAPNAPGAARPNPAPPAPSQRRSPGRYRRPPTRGSRSPSGVRRPWPLARSAPAVQPATPAPLATPFPEDPAMITTATEFVAALQALRVKAGKPSFQEMSLRTRDVGQDVPASTLRDACTRAHRLPSQPVVNAFLAALGVTETAKDKQLRKQKKEWDSAWQRVQLVRMRQAHVRQSRASKAWMVAGLAVVAAAGTLFALRPVPPRVTADCSPGMLTIEGSTAFTPTATTESQDYQGQCGGTRVTVVSEGSLDGLTSLLQSGPQGAASAIAMSDGTAPPDSTYAPLRGTPVAVILFEMVVNKDVPVRNLTTADIRAIWAGHITNWDMFPGGPDLPVRLVARGAESGTRATFEKKVLGSPEPTLSSTDCVHRDRDPGSPVIRCEQPSTPDLLAAVARTPGAIGYAEVWQAARHPDVVPVTLGGLEPTIYTAQLTDGYPFWAVEYLYTYGMPSYQAPASGFLRYMTTPAAKDVLRSLGFTPCSDEDQSLALCRS